VEKREGNQPDAMQIKLFAFAISPSLSKIRRTWRRGTGKGKGKGGQTCKSAWENFTPGGGQTKGENPGGGGGWGILR